MIHSNNMDNNNNDNNLDNMPREVNVIITSSIKKDIVAMSNIKCTSSSFSRVKHATPERRVLSQEIIDECIMCADLVIAISRIAGEKKRSEDIIAHDIESITESGSIVASNMEGYYDIVSLFPIVEYIN